MSQIRLMPDSKVGDPAGEDRRYLYLHPRSLKRWRTHVSGTKIPSAVVAVAGGAISIVVIAAYKGRCFTERLRRVLVPDLRRRLTRSPAETRQSLNWITATWNIKFETCLECAPLSGRYLKSRNYRREECYRLILSDFLPANSSRPVNSRWLVD